MKMSHLHTVSRQPQKACVVPTTPAFITTLQCFGQFFQTILTSFSGEFASLSMSVNTLFATLLTLLLKGGNPEPDLPTT